MTAKDSTGKATPGATALGGPRIPLTEQRADLPVATVARLPADLGTYLRLLHRTMGILTSWNRHGLVQVNGHAKTVLVSQPFGCRARTAHACSRETDAEGRFKFLFRLKAALGSSCVVRRASSA